MPLETHPFDPAVYLESEAAAAAYLTEALDFRIAGAWTLRTTNWPTHVPFGC